MLGLIIKRIKASQEARKQLLIYQRSRDSMLKNVNGLEYILQTAENIIAEPEMTKRIERIRYKMDAIRIRAKQLDIAVKECNKEAASAIEGTLNILGEELMQETDYFSKKCIEIAENYKE